jgi:hypothetical protein
MTDKPKTIQEALAEVQKNLSEVDLGGSGAGDFSARERTVFKQRKGFSIEKPTAANTASTISPTPTSSGSTAAPASSTGAATGGSTTPPAAAPEPAKTEPPKPAEAPKPEPAKMSFDDAYAKARQMAKSAGKDPNTAQFKFDRGGGEKVYQSAATKSDYVSMDKQFKVDIDAPSTTKNPAGPNATVDAPLPPKKPAKIGENKLTNPLIAAFLQLQETNPSNMFEAAKKAKKDHDGDGKIESGKDEYFGSREAAAKKAGKMEEEQIDEIKVSTADSYLSKRTEQARKGLLPGDRNPTSKTELKNMTNAANRTDKDYYKKRGFKKVGEETEVDEELKGSQHKIDANKNNKIDAHDFKLLRSKKKVKEDAEESKLPKDWGEGVEFSEEELAFFASVEETFTPTEPSRVNKDQAGHTDLNDEVTEAKKKEEPSTERDARQHIQVVAGQAAAGREIDFPHNNGKSTKISPDMGRKITAHLNGLKPAERQAKVKAMHDSPEGMKM